MVRRVLICVLMFCTLQMPAMAATYNPIIVQVKRERCLTGTRAISQILRKENWFRHRYPGQTYEKWVVTSSHFSRQAVEEARVGGITLLDREKLQEWSAGV